MQIADIPGASQRVVMRGRHRLTSKYVVEITLSVECGRKVFECVWHPQPSKSKQWALAPRALRAMQPYFVKAAQMDGLTWEVGG